METVLVFAIALLVLVGAVLALLARQDALPFSVVSLRTLGNFGTRMGRGDRLIAREAAPFDAETAAQVTPYIAAPVAAPRTPAAAPLPAVPPAPAREIDPARIETMLARLEGIERRLDDLSRDFDRQTAALNVELGRATAAWSARVETDNARREVAWERLRGDLLAAVSGTAPASPPVSDARRADVSADLYARLARLEAALAAVTNPVLLPSEVYAPPAEFTPEALVWENWNEVGERAFALADAFSAQRLHLSVQTRDDVAMFVTRLRTLLTRSIYPNLKPDADRAQQAALRAALETIAAELPKARATLEREYGEERGR